MSCLEGHRTHTGDTGAGRALGTPGWDPGWGRAGSEGAHPVPVAMDDRGGRVPGAATSSGSNPTLSLGVTGGHRPCQHLRPHRGKGGQRSRHPPQPPSGAESTPGRAPRGGHGDFPRVPSRERAPEIASGAAASRPAPHASCFPASHASRSRALNTGAAAHPPGSLPAPGTVPNPSRGTPSRPSRSAAALAPHEGSGWPRLPPGAAASSGGSRGVSRWEKRLQPAQPALALPPVPTGDPAGSGAAAGHAQPGRLGRHLGATAAQIIHGTKLGEGGEIRRVTEAGGGTARPPRATGGAWGQPGPAGTARPGVPWALAASAGARRVKQGQTPGTAAPPRVPPGGDRGDTPLLGQGGHRQHPPGETEAPPKPR